MRVTVVNGRETVSAAQCLETLARGEPARLAACERRQVCRSCVLALAVELS